MTGPGAAEPGSAQSSTAERRRAGRRDHRLASAGLRAVAGQPRAEIRQHLVEVADAAGRARPTIVVVPWLSLDLPPGPDGVTPTRRRRGVTDALGLRVRHSDPDLHWRLSPEAPLERIVFDIAEQFRCEALADPAWRGVRANTRAAFDQWSEEARAARIDETGVGLLVYTITHMLRYRLLRIASSEAVDDVIETTRGNLARLVGHALRALPTAADDQEAFAEPAREIARLLSEMAGDATELDGPSPAALFDQRLLVPEAWERLEAELAAEEADGPGGDSGPDDDPDLGYRVWTRANDIEVHGGDLYPPAVLRDLRRQLDAGVRAQAISIARLAQRLQRLFPSWRDDGWRGGQTDGPLDPARLAHIVVDPLDPEVRRLPHARPTGDAAVTFLIDTSGSMKLQRYETVAVVVDTLARALELAGATCEVLGFTTATWTGGRSAADWRRAGRPAEPGRLADLQHIVYKPADTPWRQARLSLAAMARTDHYREGVDGEAVLWAWRRLAARPERRRLLVVISDGHPSEAATANANGDLYLDDHLRRVAGHLERGWGRHPAGVRLGAVSLDGDLSATYTSSLTVDLDATITIGTYGLLEDLFG